MDRVINRFVYMLKLNGLRIAPSETIDALRALSHVSLDERETVRTVLCSTLMKETRHRPLFDTLFDLFFGFPLQPPLEPEGSELHEQPLLLTPTDSGMLSETDQSAPPEMTLELEREIEPPFHPPYDPDAINFATLSQHLVLSRNKALQERMQQSVTYYINTRRARQVARPGELSTAASTDELDVEMSLNALSELLDDLSELGVDGELRNHMVQRADAIIAGLSRVSQYHHRRELALRQGQLPDETTRQHAQRYGFTEEERREMDDIVRRLSRQMRGALSYRRAIDRSGRIHVSRTIRNSLRYDGIPFAPVLANRRKERPRIVVICDVSLSVRNTARFMLHLVYSLQELFERVRSFVFVSDLIEVSSHFEQSSIDEAIALVFHSGQIDTDANSNYGRALEIFHDQYLSAITNRTTVIMLGDGRGNRNPPNAWVLETIRRRARQLIWLNPESRGSWQLAGSDMRVYEPICHRVEVVRNLTQLGQVTEDLVRRSLVV